jgi:glycolate oxidase FAD binding subunit
MDYVLSQMSEQVTAARANFRPIEIVGGGTKRFLGNPLSPQAQAKATRLEMKDLSGVVDHEPSELVITAWAGTPLQEIEATLAKENQMLAFDPPSFAKGSTIGGAVAAGLSGPLSFGYGPLRHYVLGTQLLDAQGRVMTFGGQVMKNVAGYDVSRLLAGSLGMFGAIVQLSLKVMPVPLVDQTVCFAMDETEALARCEGLRAKSWPVKAAAWLPSMREPGGELAIRLCGAQSAVKEAREALGGDLLEPVTASQWWSAFRDQTAAFFSTQPLWRVAVRANTPALSLGDTAFDMGGEVRWIQTDREPDELRARALAAGGHATLFRWDGAQALPTNGVFQPLGTTALSVVKRLKDEFDPKSIFNSGRLVAGL